MTPGTTADVGPRTDHLTADVASMDGSSLVQTSERDSGGLAGPAESRGARVLLLAAHWLPLTAVIVLAAFLRLRALTAVGFNSDEAVYAGTAASMAGDQQLQGMFPVFRAHPLLFQILVSLFSGDTVDEGSARFAAATVGVGGVLTVFLLGRRMYGTLVGTLAALILAVMPYHVVVSRQVLLDGLVVPFATLALYCVVRYCERTEGRWLLAAGGMMGLAILSKEISLVLLGGLYAFFAVTPSARLRLRHVLSAAGVVAALAAVFPIVVRASGHGSTGSNYVLWQLSRRPNHSLLFYAETLPSALGVLTLVAAAAGLLWLRRQSTWREPLLVWWVVVPSLFFTTWPVKGYQYLLPIAPAVAVLAARAIAHLATVRLLADRPRLRRGTVATAGLVLAASLTVPTWSLVNPSNSGTFLAGTGGVPGGREAGLWIRNNVPDGAQLFAVGPSMANILQFYGRKRVYGLSVSPNPHERNPAYAPVSNPDWWVRDGRVQYLVWDSYSAARTPFFTQNLRDLVDKYHGVAVYTSSVHVRLPSGGTSAKPVVIVYQVWTS